MKSYDQQCLAIYIIFHSWYPFYFDRISRECICPGGRLNIKMPSYQYRDSHVKDKTVSPTVLSLTWESPYLGKTVFILRRGPGSPETHFGNETNTHNPAGFDRISGVFVETTNKSMLQFWSNTIVHGEVKKYLPINFFSHGICKTTAITVRMAKLHPENVGNNRCCFLCFAPNLSMMIVIMKKFTEVLSEPILRYDWNLDHKEECKIDINTQSVARYSANSSPFRPLSSDQWNISLSNHW